MYYTFGRMDKRFSGDSAEATALASPSPSTPRVGASATADGGGVAFSEKTAEEYAKSFIPRFPSQPWTAPAYDSALNLPSEPPRVFCMASRGGLNAQGNHDEPGCTCVTEQGTRYDLDDATCRFVARNGQYEPYRHQREDRFADGGIQMDRAMDEIRSKGQGGAVVAKSQRLQGTFPESPGYQLSTSSTPSTDIQLCPVEAVSS